MRNPKKSKNIMLFSVILVAVFSCAVLLKNVFSADSVPKTMPVTAPPVQTDAISQRPHITWEAVKKLAEGSLSYQSIRDSFYYKEIGSGLYIISFPIDNAPGVSLISSSTSPSAVPMTVGLRCESADLSLKLNAENLGIIMDLYSNSSSRLGPVVYENTRYGFRFYLPETWKGYSIVEEQWKGTSGADIAEAGAKLLIRHPDWTEKNPRQDIPIMVFTLDQWDALQKGEFSVGAAPIGPSKLGSNSVFVFALPARYNYAFQTGFEEVEEILKSNPLLPSELLLRK